MLEGNVLIRFDLQVQESWSDTEWIQLELC